mgnify:FL=1
MKFVDPVDQKYLTTNFKDVIIEADIVETDFVNEPEEKYLTPFTSNKHRLEEIIREHKDNITIARIRNGEAITPKELSSLEKILFKEQLDKNKIEQEIGSSLDLITFIINLMGRSANSVDKAFAKFINTYQLNATQIKFIETLKMFLTKNGKIDPAKLYDSPFKNIHSLGVDGVFNENQADVLFDIISEFNHKIEA